MTTGSTNIAVTRRMFDAWERLDIEAVLATMTPDIRYHNVPLPVLEGHAAVRKFLEDWGKLTTSGRIEVHAEVEGPDGTVMDERTDIFVLREGGTASIRCAGIFRFRGSLICDWRDYFDLAEWTRQVG